MASRMPLALARTTLKHAGLQNLSSHQPFSSASLRVVTATSPSSSNSHHLHLAKSRALSTNAGSGASPLTSIAVGGGLLAVAGAGITLYYAHESEAFRASLCELAPFLGPLLDLVTPAPAVERPAPSIPAPRIAPKPAAAPIQPPRAKEPVAKKDEQPKKKNDEHPDGARKEPKDSADPPAASRNTPSSSSAADHVAPAAVPAVVLATHASSSESGPAVVAPVAAAVVVVVELPHVPSAAADAAAILEAADGGPVVAWKQKADPVPRGLEAPPSAVEPDAHVQLTPSDSTVHDTTTASATAPAPAVAIAGPVAVVVAPPAAVEAGATAASTAANSVQHDTTAAAAAAATDTAMVTATAVASAVAASEAAAAVAAGAALEGAGEKLAILNQLLEQAERRSKELEQQLEAQMVGEVRRRDAQREADALAAQHTLNEERVRAKAHLAAEVATVKVDYERTLKGELAAVREHYLKELQEHLQVQQKIHEEDVARRMVDLTKKIKEESESDLNLRVGRERAARLTLLESHFQRLKAVEGILASRADLEASMHRAAAVATAAAALRDAFDSAQPLRPQVDALLAACGAQDELVPVLVATIPAVALDRGIGPAAASVARFPALKRAVRRVALVPDHGTLVDHALAWLAAAITFEKHGLVGGDDVEAVLARAEHYVAASNIDAAARELAQLPGAAGRVAADWVQQARTRLEVAQTLATLLAHVDLQHLAVL